MIGVVMYLSEHHEARVRQGILKLAHRDRLKIRCPDRAGKGMVLEMWRSPHVLRGRVTDD